MHLDELFRGIGLILSVIVIGAVLWAVSQIVPQVQKVATLPAQIELENARTQGQTELTRAQTQAQLQAVPTLQALEVKAKEQAIENERIKAQAAANAEVIAAQGQAERERSTGQAVIMLAAAFILAVVIFAGWQVLNSAMSARNFKQALELAKASGARLELPNGHAVTFAFPGPERRALTAGPVEGAMQSAERAPVEVERRTGSGLADLKE